MTDFVFFLLLASHFLIYSPMLQTHMILLVQFLTIAPDYWSIRAVQDFFSVTEYAVKKARALHCEKRNFVGSTKKRRQKTRWKHKVRSSVLDFMKTINTLELCLGQKIISVLVRSNIYIRRSNIRYFCSNFTVFQKNTTF